MYIGHYAVAFAAKKAAPETSLGTLIAASQLIDLIWPVLVLMGVERVAVDPGNTAFTPLDFQHYPYTHSLLMVMVWATLFAGVYWVFTRYKAGTVTVWLAVISHWVLDAMTHRPDLPLYPGGSARVGLGLWNSVPSTLVFEVTVFMLGLMVFLKVSSSRDRIGTLSFWALTVFLVGTYLANIFGPPPPAGKAVAISAMLLWLLVPWGYWIDSHRSVERFRFRRRRR